MRASIGILVLAVGVTGCLSYSTNPYPAIAPQPGWGELQPKSKKAAGVMPSKWVNRRLTSDNLFDRGGDVIGQTTTSEVAPASA